MQSLSFLLGHAADTLLIAASLGAAIFCLVLSRRLARLSRIDNGLGGAIAVLSAQVDDMNTALTAMKSGTASSAERLEDLNREARQLTEELELMLSACHDIGEAPLRAPASAGAASEPGSDAASPEEEGIVIFGSRRKSAEPPGPAPVPFFLKNRSRLTETG